MGRLIYKPVSHKLRRAIDGDNSIYRYPRARGDAMAKYLIQVTYSDDALAELVRHPQDRGSQNCSNDWAARSRFSTMPLGNMIWSS